MKEIIEIKEDISLKQDDKKIILEKGDKIQIIKEDQTITWKDFRNQRLLVHERLSEFIFEIPYQSVKMEGLNSSCKLVGNHLEIYIEKKFNKFILTPDDIDLVTIYEDFNYGFKINLKGVRGVFYGYY